MDRSDRSKSAISRSTKSGKVRVGAFRAASPERCPERLRDIAHPHEIADAKKAFAFRLLRYHRENVQVGKVAHVDDLKTEAGIGRHTSLEQPADDFDGTGAAALAGELAPQRAALVLALVSG